MSPEAVRPSLFPLLVSPLCQGLGSAILLYNLRPAYSPCKKTGKDCQNADFKREISHKCSDAAPTVSPVDGFPIPNSLNSKPVASPSYVCFVIVDWTLKYCGESSCRGWHYLTFCIITLCILWNLLFFAFLTETKQLCAYNKHCVLSIFLYSFKFWIFFLLKAVAKIHTFCMILVLLVVNFWSAAVASPIVILPLCTSIHLFICAIQVKTRARWRKIYELA